MYVILSKDSKNEIIMNFYYSDAFKYWKNNAVKIKSIEASHLLRTAEDYFYMQRDYELECQQFSGKNAFKEFIGSWNEEFFWKRIHDLPLK